MISAFIPILPRVRAELEAAKGPNALIALGNAVRMLPACGALAAPDVERLASARASCHASVGSGVPDAVEATITGIERQLAKREEVCEIALARNVAESLLAAIDWLDVPWRPEALASSSSPYRRSLSGLRLYLDEVEEHITRSVPDEWREISPSAVSSGLKVAAHLPPFDRPWARATRIAALKHDILAWQDASVTADGELEGLVGRIAIDAPDVEALKELPLLLRWAYAHVAPSYGSAELDLGVTDVDATRFDVEAALFEPVESKLSTADAERIQELLAEGAASGCEVLRWLTFVEAASDYVVPDAMKGRDLLLDIAAAHDKNTLDSELLRLWEHIDRAVRREGPGARPAARPAWLQQRTIAVSHAPARPTEQRRSPPPPERRAMLDKPVAGRSETPLALTVDQPGPRHDFGHRAFTVVELVGVRVVIVLKPRGHVKGSFVMTLIGGGGRTLAKWSWKKGDNARLEAMLASAPGACVLRIEREGE